MGEKFMDKRELKQYIKTIPANSLPTEEDKNSANSGESKYKEPSRLRTFVLTTLITLVAGAGAMSMVACNTETTEGEGNPNINPPIVNPIDETSEETYRIMCETKIKQIVANSWEGSTMSDISIVSMDANDDGKVEFTAKVDGKTVSFVADFGSSISDADYYKDMYTELSDLSTVPVSQILTEVLTEAEYKVMVEEKIKDAITNKFNSDPMRIRFGQSLSNFNIVAININGYVYGYGDVSGLGTNYFVTGELDKEVLDGNNFESIDDNLEDKTVDNFVSSVSVEKSISNEVTESSYNNFLNSVVTDPGFKTALEGVGITLPSGIDDWTDVATVVNAKVHNTGNIDVLFVDIITNKTISIRVNSHLTVQESSTVSKQVENTTIKNKVITVVGEIKNFSTIDSDSVLLENNKDIKENFNKTSGYIISFGD